MTDSHTPEVHEYVNADGTRHGAYAGTEIDAAFKSSTEWIRDADADGGAAPVTVESPSQILEVKDASAEPDPDIQVADEVQPDPAPLEPRSDDDRAALTRDELNQLARDAGHENPEALPTKAAVIAVLDGE